MIVRVNCKKKPIDYDSNYRVEFVKRMKSKKSFNADFSISDDLTVIRLAYADRNQNKQLGFPTKTVEKISFFLSSERVYWEIVLTQNGTKLSLCFASTDSNETLGQSGVFDIRRVLDGLAEHDGIQVIEYIDENSLDIVPDGDNVEGEPLDDDSFSQGNGDVDESQVAILSEPLSISPLESTRSHLSSEPVETAGLNGEEEKDSRGHLDDINQDNEFSSALSEETPLSNTIPMSYHYVYGIEQEDDIKTENLNESSYDETSHEEKEKQQSDNANSEIGNQQEAEQSAEHLTDGNDDVMEDTNQMTTTSINEKEQYTQPAENETVASIGEEAQSAISEGTSQLQQIQARLEKEKARRIAEIAKLTSMNPDGDYDDDNDDDDDDDQLDNDSSFEDSNAMLKPHLATGQSSSLVDSVSVDIKASNENDDDVPENEAEDKANDETVTTSLRGELSRLDDAATEVNQQLQDYGDLLEQSKAEQDAFIERIDSLSGNTDSTIKGLIAMLQEQQATNEQLNTAIKREQVTKQHYLNQLDIANGRVADQTKALEEFKRKLKIAQESQKKSEKFVRDAQNGVRKVIAAANAKVDEAIVKLDTMKSQMEESENKAQAALAEKDQALRDKDAAIKDKKEVLKKLEEEKEHSSHIMDEFDKQLEDFTNETLVEIHKQIKRTDDAERKYSEKSQKVTQLENELSQAKTKIMALESRLQKRELDLQESKKSQQGANESADKLTMELQDTKKSLEDTGEALDEVEASLVAEKAENERLKTALEKAKSDRDSAIAEKLQVIDATKRQHDDSVDTLKASRDEAIQASGALLESFKQAMMMPDGIMGRKKKIKAFEDAYNQCMASLQNASQKDVPAFELRTGND